MPQATSAPPRSLSDLQADVESTFVLLDLVRAGDARALDRLFHRYLGPLRRFAHGRLPSAARDLLDTNDLVQETLLQTFRRIREFEPQREGALLAYLRQAIVNRVRDELRRQARRPAPEALDVEPPDAGLSPLDAAIGREAVNRYESALQRLKGDDREAVVARVELGMSFEEVAVALGKPSADAARKAVSRALIRLAEEMRK
ncbi:MAG TPA: sigma-70 family RNA polymerase sigma factor [Vicinamibacterales bacterium]